MLSFNGNITLNNLGQIYMYVSLTQKHHFRQFKKVGTCKHCITLDQCLVSNQEVQVNNFFNARTKVRSFTCPYDERAETFLLTISTAGITRECAFVSYHCNNVYSRYS